MSEEEHVTRALAQMGKQGLINFLGSVRVRGAPERECTHDSILKQSLAASNRDLVKHLLTNSPQLSFAVLQAQIMLGLLNPVVAQVHCPFC